MLALGLGGCGGNSLVGATHSSFGAAAETLRATVYGTPQAAYSDDYVRSLPYSAISAQIGKGPKSLLVLGKIEGDRLTWYAADRSALVTRHGRVVQTAGLDTDLVATRARGSDPLMLLAQTDRQLADLPSMLARLHTRLLDFSRYEALGFPVESHLELQGEEEVMLLGNSYATRKYREVFQAPLLEWQGDNYYWLDKQTHQIRKAVQHYVPGSPPIVIEFLK